MKRNGFTLIELLVAVCIGMILTAGGLAAYRGFGERQALIQAGLKLESNLRLVQKKAFSGEKPSECSEATLNGFWLSSDSNSSYKIEVECSGVRSTVGDEIMLSDEITFSTGSFEIFFPVLKSMVTGATITLQFDTFSYEVIVEDSGVIRGKLL